MLTMSVAVRKKRWKSLVLRVMRETGVNQGELARRLGVSRPAVSQALSGTGLGLGWALEALEAMGVEAELVVGKGGER